MRNIYKVIITKTVFVEAENADEAEDLAFSDCEIMIDEVITSVEESSENEISKMMFEV